MSECKQEKKEEEIKEQTVERDQIWEVVTDTFLVKNDPSKWCSNCEEFYRIKHHFLLEKGTIFRTYACDISFINEDSVKIDEKMILNNCKLKGEINNNCEKKLFEILKDKLYVEKESTNEIKESVKPKEIKEEWVCSYCKNDNSEITITMKKRNYNFLVNLLNEVNTQDNEATALPLLYLITTEQERLVPDGYGGDKEIYIRDGEERDINQCIEEYIDDEIIYLEEVKKLKELGKQLENEEDWKKREQIVSELEEKDFELYEKLKEMVIEYYKLKNIEKDKVYYFIEKFLKEELELYEKFNIIKKQLENEEDWKKQGKIIPELEEKDFELYEKLKEMVIEYYEIETQMVSVERKYTESCQNVFFTEKACKAYLKANNYYFNKGKPYIIHAWRNYEIKELFLALKDLTGIRIEDK